MTCYTKSKKGIMTEHAKEKHFFGASAKAIHTYLVLGIEWRDTKEENGHCRRMTI